MELPISEPPEDTRDSQEFERFFKKWKDLQAQMTAEEDPAAQESLRAEAEALRSQLILMHVKLVRFLARKFKDRGEPLDDLIQQGMIGLINAIDRYELERGVKFSTYATPTILGEIRRYFRDKTWGVKVPRRVQELNLLVNRIIEELTQELGRSPGYEEIAKAVGVDVEEIIEALEISKAYDPISLDSEMSNSGRDDAATTLEDHVSDEDDQLANWETRMQVQDALRMLPPRERSVIELTFFEGMAQTEIAQELGISQMHVSRLLRKALVRLREYFRRE
jgi:RNA polymerase sigma-B factor